MILAIASGKGGTGKTTLSVAIAEALKESVQLLDCDVEEPNTHIFLDIKEPAIQKVYVPVPMVNQEKCTLCGKCQEICEFNAIAVLKDRVMVFNELCHSCGGCIQVCPEKAIEEIDHPIGHIVKGESDKISLFQGKLDVGHTMSPPLIRAVKRHIKTNMLSIIDCPPGNACSVITAFNHADYVILVTEASPFGLHDLMLSVETLRVIDLPFGVIINRGTTEYNSVAKYCFDEKVDVLLEIPESMKVAKVYSDGGTLLDAMPEIRDDLRCMVQRIKEQVNERDSSS